MAKPSRTDFAVDVFMTAVGLLATVLGAIDFGHGVIFGIGLGVLFFGIHSLWGDFKRWKLIHNKNVDNG